ncbi:MAG: hypothetical protein KBD63_01425 [Bacteriovoracaceae bacterium]|nr:hypothetical protein [Bacteriovoracaceae bacterium]
MKKISFLFVFFLSQILFAVEQEAPDMSNLLIRCNTSNDAICRTMETLCLPSTRTDAEGLYDIRSRQIEIQNTTQNPISVNSLINIVLNSLPTISSQNTGLSTGQTCTKNLQCQSLLCQKSSESDTSAVCTSPLSICRCARAGEAVSDSKFCCDGFTKVGNVCVQGDPPNILLDAVEAKVTAGCKIEFTKIGTQGGTSLTPEEIKSLLDNLNAAVFQQASFYHLFNNNLVFNHEFQNKLQEMARIERTGLDLAQKALQRAYAGSPNNPGIYQLQQMLVARSKDDPSLSDSVGVDALDLLIREIVAQHSFYKALFETLDKQKELYEEKTNSYKLEANKRQEDRAKWKNFYTLIVDSGSAREYVTAKLRSKKFAGEEFRDFTPKRIADPQFPKWITERPVSFESFGKYYSARGRLFRKKAGSDPKWSPEEVERVFAETIQHDDLIQTMLGIPQIKNIPEREAVIKELVDVVSTTFFGFGATKQGPNDGHSIYTKVRYGEFLARNTDMLRHYYGLLQKALMSQDESSPGVKECLVAKRALIVDSTSGSGGVMPGSPTVYQNSNITVTSSTASNSPSSPTSQSRHSTKFSSGFAPSFFSSTSLVSSGRYSQPNSTASGGLSGLGLSAQGAMRAVKTLSESKTQAKSSHDPRLQKEIELFEESLKKGISPSVLKSMSQNKTMANLGLKSALPSKNLNPSPVAQKDPEIKEEVATKKMGPALPTFIESLNESSTSPSLSPDESLAILANLSKNPVKINAEDSLFERVSKTYRRSLKNILDTRRPVNKKDEGFKEFSSK